MGRRAQAALEFLMTYGWALLVLLAALATLAYFGLMSPDRFLPDKCVANPPFSCGEYKISATKGPGGTNLLNITLQNNVGTDAAIINVTFRCSPATSGALGTVSNTSTYVINSGKTAVTLVGAQLTSSTGCSSLKTGEKFSATYDIFYRKANENQIHTGGGSIQGRVET